MQEESYTAVGTQWTNGRYRGIWKLVKNGRQYVTLKPTIPGFKEMKVEKTVWPGTWVRLP